MVEVGPFTPLFNKVVFRRDSCIHRYLHDTVLRSSVTLHELPRVPNPSLDLNLISHSKLLYHSHNEAELSPSRNQTLTNIWAFITQFTMIF